MKKNVRRKKKKKCYPKNSALKSEKNASVFKNPVKSKERHCNFFVYTSHFPPFHCLSLCLPATHTRGDETQRNLACGRL